MTRTNKAGHVLIGVPDAGADALIPTAIRRARQHGVAIDIVRVWRTVDWLLSAPASEVGGFARDEKRDEALLERAADTARELAPDLQVLVDFAPGDLYTELLERTRGASVLVVGDDLGQDASIAAWYLEHAFCPVAVVDDRGNVVAEGPGAKSLAHYGPHRS